MPISEAATSAAATHRKLRSLAAVFADPAANEHEKANAKELKGRLEKQLGDEAPDGAWTGIVRLGQGVKEMRSPTSPKTDWTHHAFRLGRMFRRGFKRWRQSKRGQPGYSASIATLCVIFRLPLG